MTSDFINRIRNEAKAEERQRTVKWIKEKAIKCKTFSKDGKRNLEYTLWNDNLAELEKGDA